MASNRKACSILNFAANDKCSRCVSRQAGCSNAHLLPQQPPSDNDWRHPRGAPTSIIQTDAPTLRDRRKNGVSAFSASDSHSIINVERQLIVETDGDDAANTQLPAKWLKRRSR